jgi:hypothetical protein
MNIRTSTYDFSLESGRYTASLAYREGNHGTSFVIQVKGANGEDLSPFPTDGWQVQMSGINLTMRNRHLNLSLSITPTTGTELEALQSHSIVQRSILTDEDAERSWLFMFSNDHPVIVRPQV